MANPSHCSLYLFFFRTDSTDSPDCLPILLSISVFTFLVFLFVLYFLVVGSLLYINLTHVGFRAHVKIASRVVSYMHRPTLCKLSLLVRKSLLAWKRLNSTTLARPDSHGLCRRPALTQRSFSETRAAKKCPCGSVRVWSGPCSGI